MNLEIIDELRKMREACGWTPYHTPENCAKSITIEAAELLEHFQWSDEADVEGVKEELADVLIYAYNLADVMELDVDEIVKNKLKKNWERFAVK
ncbi:MAG: nucleotide pyrophosphohydrolase [Eubacteriales bacterium]|nr:nucleotide pyrophosphohydrolase [Eubacteriales bacterium]